MSETPSYKRIIEERLSHEIFSNDYLVKDSATEGTTRILISEFIDLVLADSATEEDLETAVHNFVPEYNSGTSYSVGNYCIYQNELYKCITATTGDFDDNDWTTTNVMSELVSLVNAEATARTTAINNEAYYRSMSDIVLSENIAEPYNTTKSYVVGDIVSYNLYIYRCTGATTGTWDESKWEQVTVDELFDDLNFSAEAISYDNTTSGLEAENVQDAIGETITKLSAVGSASGAIATFTDGSDLSMPKLEVAIEPVQEGSGDPSPENIRPIIGWDEANVNRAKVYQICEPSDSTEITANGVTMTYLGKGKYRVKGTLTTNEYTSLNLPIVPFTIYGGDDCYIKLNNSVGLSAVSIIFKNNSSQVDSWGLYPSNRSGSYVGMRNKYTNNIAIEISSSGYGTNFDFTFKVEILSNSTANLSTYNISFGSVGTVYGGTLDVVSGVMTVDRANVLVSECTWYGSNGTFYTDKAVSTIKKGDGRYDHCISDAFKTVNKATSGQLSDGEISVDASGYIQLKDLRYSSPSDFKTAMGNTQLVYELATPLTIQLTPTVVKSLRGANNISADSGAILDAEYIRDMTTIINYILEQLNA